MDTTNTVAEIRASLTEMGVAYKARDSKSTLLALWVSANEGKTGDLADADTDCGGCENGECDGCGNYTCCDDDSALGRTSYESKVGTKWTYIYMNGELIAEVRNDAAKQVMAVLQASN